MRRLCLTLLLASTACVEDLSFEDTDAVIDDTDTDTDSDTVVADDAILFSDPDPQGSITAEVHAQQSDTWVHLDLDTPAHTDAEGPWSLAFQRYTIRLNGGVSGDGEVEAVFDPTLSYEAATSAPREGWSTDAPDADEDGEPELVFDTWYDYDPGTHVLTPKAGTWFVRGLEGRTYALEILSYYSEAGDSGSPSLRFKPVSDPER